MNREGHQKTVGGEMFFMLVPGKMLPKAGVYNGVMLPDQTLCRQDSFGCSAGGILNEKLPRMLDGLNNFCPTTLDMVFLHHQLRLLEDVRNSCNLSFISLNISPNLLESIILLQRYNLDGILNHQWLKLELPENYLNAKKFRTSIQHIIDSHKNYPELPWLLLDDVGADGGQDIRSQLEMAIPGHIGSHLYGIKIDWKTFQTEVADISNQGRFTKFLKSKLVSAALDQKVVIVEGVKEPFHFEILSQLVKELAETDHYHDNLMIQGHGVKHHRQWEKMDESTVDQS
ncbi:MAG: hypothetical protein HQL80_00070 [Magnetococcales bacterium]|nr:hypothetical protein [Magnetococcales bacterium]